MKQQATLRRTLKAYLAACLLVMLLALPVVYTLFVQMHLVVNRYAMLRQLEHGNLHTITLHASEIHWKKPGKELVVNGSLFDVKHWHRNGQLVIATGLWDEEEERLQKEANTLASHTAGIASLLKIGKWVGTLFVVPPRITPYPVVLQTYPLCRWEYYKDYLPQLALAVPTPPPLW